MYNTVLSFEYKARSDSCHCLRREGHAPDPPSSGKIIRDGVVLELVVVLRIGSPQAGELAGGWEGLVLTKRQMSPCS